MLLEPADYAVLTYRDRSKEIIHFGPKRQKANEVEIIIVGKISPNIFPYGNKSADQPETWMTSFISHIFSDFPCLILQKKFFVTYEYI